MPHATTDRAVIPYGAWPSPITPEMLTAQTIGLGAPKSDGDVLQFLPEVVTGECPSDRCPTHPGVRPCCA